MIYDLAIAGSGPAGSVAALVAARSGRSVVMFDGGDLEKPKVGECLLAGAQPLLNHLGLLHLFDKHMVSYGVASAWESSQLVNMDSIRSPHGTGWHLDRQRFDRELRETALAAGAHFMRENIRLIEPGWLLNGEVRAHYLIDATGRGAFVARKCGAAIFHDDHSLALYGWIKNSSPDTRAIIEWAGRGWWYTAALPNGLRIVSYHSTPKVVDEVRCGWWDALQATVHIKNFVDGEPRELKCGPAGGARLDRFGGPGWLATGDAALAFDPLSSQGIFNALYTGMTAGEAFGNPALIAKYEARLLQIRENYFAARNYYWSTAGSLTGI